MKDAIIAKQRELIKYLIKKIPPAKRGQVILKRLKAISALESSQKEPTKTIKGFKKWANNLGIGESSQKEPAEVSEEIELNKFTRILDISCVENLASLTSNEKHTIYDAFKIYISQSLHQSQKTESDFPDIDFEVDIANELSRDELIKRFVEMHKQYKEMREEWFEVCQLNRDNSSHQVSQEAKQSDCNHVIGANDESGKCFKCGETVSITTRYEKRES